MPMLNVRPFVCIVGGQRRPQQLAEAVRAEEAAGRIPLALGFGPPPREGLSSPEGWRLDRMGELYLDYADEVLFLSAPGVSHDDILAEAACAGILGKRVRWACSLDCYRGDSGGVAVAPDHSAAQTLIYGLDREALSGTTTKLDPTSLVWFWLADAPPPSEACCASWLHAAGVGPNGHRPRCDVGCEGRTAAEWAAFHGVGQLGEAAAVDDPGERTAHPAPAPAAQLPPPVVAGSPVARPTIVCIVGSLRFRDEYERAAFEETMGGRIMLLPGFYRTCPDTGAPLHLLPEEEEGFDRLGRAKVNLADEVLVLNVGGHLGDSTKGLVAHARATGKRVRWLRPLHCYTDGEATVVAHDLAEAMRLLDAEDDVLAGPVRELLDSSRLALWRSDAPPPTDACCAQWAADDIREASPNGHRPRCPVGCPSRTYGEWAEMGPGVLHSRDARP